MAQTFRAFRVVDRALALLERALNAAGGLILVGFAFLVLADVIARYLINYSIPGIYELMQLALVVIVYCGIAYAQRQGDHIRIEVFSDDNFPRMQRIVRIGGDLAGIAICAVIAWRSAHYAYDAWEMGDSTSGLIAWRTWPSLAAVPLGFTLLGLRIALDLVRWAMRGRDGV